MNEVYTREWPPFDPPFKERKIYRDIIDGRMMEDGSGHRYINHVWRKLQIKAIDDPFINHLELIEIHQSEAQYPGELCIEIEYWECITEKHLKTAKIICS